MEQAPVEAEHERTVTTVEHRLGLVRGSCHAADRDRAPDQGTFCAGNGIDEARVLELTGDLERRGQITGVL